LPSELKIAEAAVKAQVSAILRKLGAANRTQAVRLASRLSADTRAARLSPDNIE
jgi:DNA-binding NarL/FixJ family response regulator